MPEESAEVSERRQPTLVVITGMSGAGRTQAIHTFEDFGYFCIDNLPPALIGRVVELASLEGSRVNRIAIVCDVRAQEFFSELVGELRRLKVEIDGVHVLFLEADDETLVTRFKETRRRHPLCEEGSVIEGIRVEREALAEVRELADIIIDTRRMAPQRLRDEIRHRFFGESLKSALAITVSSFGFKYGGAPADADMVMDVRFLPNPYYEDELRELDGTDDSVREFVLERKETKEFMRRWSSMLKFLTPHYLGEGRTHLSIALGCTGGRHRSVTLAEETARVLRGRGLTVTVNHRDIGKGGTA